LSNDDQLSEESFIDGHGSSAEDKGESANILDQPNNPAMNASENHDKVQYDSQVLSILKDISSTLNSLAKRVETTEHDIKLVKSKLTCNTSSSSDTGGTKVLVPQPVQVSTNNISLILFVSWYSISLMGNCKYLLMGLDH